MALPALRLSAMRACAIARSAAPSRRAARSRGFVVPGEKSLLHARLVIGAAQELGIAVEHLLLDIGGQRIVAPRLAHQRARAFGVALREQRARQHQAAHARLRRRAVEEAQRLRRLDVLDPKHRLGAAAEHREARPARIGGDEGEVALAVDAVVVAAQDEPFDELARRRVRDGGRDAGRLAGAAAAQGVDRALDQRHIGLGGLRCRPWRQRDLRHHGFLADVDLSSLDLPLATFFPVGFAALPADLTVAAAELLAPPRLAAA